MNRATSIILGICLLILAVLRVCIMGAHWVAAVGHFGWTFAAVVSLVGLCLAAFGYLKTREQNQSALIGLVCLFVSIGLTAFETNKAFEFEGGNSYTFQVVAVSVILQLITECAFFISIAVERYEKRKQAQRELQAIEDQESERKGKEQQEATRAHQLKILEIQTKNERAKNSHSPQSEKGKGEKKTDNETQTEKGSSVQSKRVEALRIYFKAFIHEKGRDPNCKEAALYFFNEDTKKKQRLMQIAAKSAGLTFDR